MRFLRYLSESNNEIGFHVYYYYMKTLFTIFAFAFLNMTAQAGQELDRFKQERRCLVCCAESKFKSDYYLCSDTGA
jgi:hypothetical protein